MAAQGAYYGLVNAQSLNAKNMDDNEAHADDDTDDNKDDLRGKLVEEKARWAKSI
jgi:hypothetical protein